MKAKVLILNGGHAREPLSEMERRLTEVSSSYGCATKALHLRELTIAPCLGCFGCWMRTPGVCVIDDDARDVTEKMIRSDVIVYLTPVVFGGYSPELKGALDRSIGLISPLFERVGGETHHKKRYDRYPCLLGIGVQRGRDATEARIFETLVRRNAINLHAPRSVAQVVDPQDEPALINNTIERAFREVLPE